MDQCNHYPGIRQAIWLLALVISLVVGLSIAALVLDAAVDFPLLENPTSIAVINLVVIGFALILGLKKTKAPIRDVFPFLRIRVSLLIPMCLTILGASILLSEIDNLFRVILPMPDSVAHFFRNLVEGRTNLGGSIAAALVVAPLTEELLFRGLILRGFLSRYPVRKAVLASALFFAVFHLNPWQFLGAAILGVLFAWWFVQTRSLVPCLFGHFLTNALPFILLDILHVEIQGLTNEPTEVVFQPLWLDSAGLLLAGLGVGLLIRMFRENEQERNT